MLLPDDKFAMIEHYFGVSLAKLLIGARFEGLGGNAALYRDIQNGIRSRIGTKKSTFRRFLDYLESNGVGRNPSKKLTPAERQRLERRLEHVATEGPAVTPGDANGSFAGAVKKILDADRDIRQFVAQRDIRSIKARIASLDFSQTESVRAAMRQLEGINDPDAAPKIIEPLRLLTILWLIAFLEAGCLCGASSELVALMPRAGPSKVVRPMTRWMERLRTILGEESQAATSRIVGAGNDRVQDMKPIWRGKIPGDQKIASIVRQACEHRPERDEQFRRCEVTIHFVRCFDVLLNESLQIIPERLDYDPLLPFGDYSRLYDLAVRTFGAAR